MADVVRRVSEAATQAHRDPESVTIVGVSKTAEWSAIRAAYDAGLRYFGENRVQDARARIPADHPDDLRLHFIGQLQTNKVGQMLDLFDYVESVDRSSLIAELQKQTAKRNQILPVLLQVNVAGETQKAGCAP
ncbi:MAG TPA: alanine racemase, partial [Thermomicrobiales bacterium]|nr:alanine racemase [Thermomicrobiales bacterium]